jgi:hypothetical protein
MICRCPGPGPGHGHGLLEKTSDTYIRLHLIILKKEVKLEHGGRFLGCKIQGGSLYNVYGRKKMNGPKIGVRNLSLLYYHFQLHLLELFVESLVFYFPPCKMESSDNIYILQDKIKQNKSYSLNVYSDLLIT